MSRLRAFTRLRAWISGAPPPPPPPADDAWLFYEPAASAHLLTAGII